MIQVYHSKVPSGIIDYVQQREKLLVADHSNYAKGRLRRWLVAEAPLTSKHTFGETHPDFADDSLIWKWAKHTAADVAGFDAEIGLLHVGGANCGDPDDEPDDGNGGECGIRKHRDAAFADTIAFGINLSGSATFGIVIDGKTYHVPMVSGTAVLFDCKAIHFAQAGPNRLALNLWRISPKRRQEWRSFRCSKSGLLD